MAYFTRTLAALALLAAAAPSQAAMFTESFDSPNFSAWKTRWFGENSNATVRDYGGSEGRGNNLTGLTVYDGDQWDGGQINIRFDAAFGASITSFSFDLLNYASGIEQHLFVYDMNGVALLDAVLSVVPQDPSADNGSNNGYDFADSKYTRYTVTSTSGISGFSVLPFGTEGNLSIDDLTVITAAPVPEPASWALMIGGFALAGATLRRRAAKIAFA
jgi:hypothetical protein